MERDDTNDFYKKIGKKYKKFYVKKEKKSFDKICNPKEYKLQTPQIFLSQYINPNTENKSILVFHRIGSGKTCTSIRIAEVWKKHRKIIVVVPASLIGNYRNELRSKCVGENYITDKEKSALKTYNPLSEEYQEIIDVSDERDRKSVV